MPPAIEKHLEPVGKSDADGVCSENGDRGITDQPDSQQIRDPETGQSDEDKSKDARDHVRRTPGIARPVDSEHETEAQRKRERAEIENKGGRETFGDFLQDGTLVFDATQLSGEEIAHDESVLLVQRAIEMEFLAEDALHILGNFRVQLAPRIRTAGRQRDDEKGNQADEKQQHDRDEQTADDESGHGLFTASCAYSGR